MLASMIQLEDNLEDVLRKALRGAGLTTAEAARRAGLPEGAAEALLHGQRDAGAARALAPVLGLDPAALAGYPGHPGEPVLPPEVARLVLPFGELGVNAWLVRAPGASLLFDTGPEPGALASALQVRAVHRLDAVFVTHGHPDHIGGLSAVEDLATVVFSPEHERLPGSQVLEPHETHEFGPVRVTALATEGHTPGALSYRIDGLSQPVCVVGDALFAGSMGGCRDPESYLLGRMRIRDQILTLARETLLLPGHGPATRVAAELAHNPFFAGRAGAETNG